MAPPNPDPTPLSNVQSLATRVDEIDLAKGMLLVETLVTLESTLAIKTGIENGDTLKLSLAILRVSF
jgi:hypothetical protein